MPSAAAPLAGFRAESMAKDCSDPPIEDAKLSARQGAQSQAETGAHNALPFILVAFPVATPPVQKSDAATGTNQIETT